MCVIGRVGIPFDFTGATDAIFGKKEDDKYSLFLGLDDKKNTTNEGNRLADNREGKDYNSFGKTKKIIF